MPDYRPDLESIPRYRPGKPIEEVARELGIESIVKLASNEFPGGPFPEVVAAIAAVASGVNRYPDSSQYELTRAIAEHHKIDHESVWVGAGSSEILRCAALSVGGQGSSAVFAKPSFVMYRIVTLVAHAEPLAVPLNDDFDHDLDAMLTSIRDDTTIVYVCNPNNPTGGIRSGDDVRRFIEAVDQRITIIVDEAYAEFVADPTYESLASVAPEFPNVLVARTFSKIYSLAGLRVGYGIGHPDLISNLRVTQPPFAVTAVAQAAALEALKHHDIVAERSQRNADGRRRLADELETRGYRVVPSQANFVYFEPEGDAQGMFDALLRKGVIVRVLGGGIRVSVGEAPEIDRFLDALDALGSP